MRRRLSIIGIAVGFLFYVIITTILASNPHGGIALNLKSFGTTKSASGSSYLLVKMELTNASGMTIHYVGESSKSPVCNVLYPSPTGWKQPPGMWLCGTGLRDFTLPNSGAIQFEVWVDTNKPCKLEFNYSDGRTPGRIWNWVPGWLEDRLRWARGEYSVTSEIIDPSDPRAVEALRSTNVPPKGDKELKLAGQYWRGDGVEKNVEQALHWYLVATTNGNPEAMYNLGTIYDFGLRVEPDKEKAMEFYLMAADHGHTGARERLLELSKK